MSTDLAFYMQDLPGGMDTTPPRTRLDNYAWRRFGPQDDKDAVMFSMPFDPTVRSSGSTLTFIPKGRICSMTPNGTAIPGILDADVCPVTMILIGSNSDSGDVTGMYYGDPATHPEGASMFKDHFNAPFQSLIAGYVYETTEFDPLQINEFKPGTLLTTTVDNITDFDTAGIIRVGVPFVDHIIGIVTELIDPVGINQHKMSIRFQGLALPRLTKDMVNPANLRD